MSAPAPRWLEPRTWETLRVELGDRAACALDVEERWGRGSAVLRLHEADERPPGRAIAIADLDDAVVAAQKTPR
jgi:hypothetical protein